MARMALIKYSEVVIKKKKHQAKKIAPNNLTIKLKVIHIDCMCGCGNSVKAEVNPSDIIPNLGRPRGLRLRCHTCNNKLRNHINNYDDRTYSLYI